MPNLTFPQKFRAESLILCVFCSLAIFAGIPLFEAIGWLPSGLWKRAGVAAPLVLGGATALAALFLSRPTSKADLSLLLSPLIWNFFVISLGLILMVGHFGRYRTLFLLAADVIALVIGYNVLLQKSRSRSA
jgi:hypothetical protein